MQKILFSYLLLFLFSLDFATGNTLYKTKSTAGRKDTAMILFYNVENLFDTVDDTLTIDEEFLPDRARYWNNSKYYEKLIRISKVLIASGNWELPEIIGLCEVENRRVLVDLVNKTPLKNGDYRIIHKESPDRRGIDVALLYRKTAFRPLSYSTFPVFYKKGQPTSTREILYVEGILKETDTLHLFVNHWPSRYGGYKQTVHKRSAAAATLRRIVDSVYGEHHDPHIVIMGDFNDNPRDKSISKILKARSPHSPESADLLSLPVEPGNSAVKGTLKHQGEWSVFDQIIVSPGLLNQQSNFFIHSAKQYIFAPDFLLIDDEKYTGKKPFRTFVGFKYTGGFSDHLPVYIKVVIQR